MRASQEQFSVKESESEPDFMESEKEFDQPANDQTINSEEEITVPKAEYTYVESKAVENLDLIECENCQRKFFPEKLSIHQKICKPGKPLGWTLRGQREVYKPPAIKKKDSRVTQEEVKQERAIKMIASSFE